MCPRFIRVLTLCIKFSYFPYVESKAIEPSWACVRPSPIMKSNVPYVSGIEISSDTTVQLAYTFMYIEEIDENVDVDKSAVYFRNALAGLCQLYFNNRWLCLPTFPHQTVFQIYHNFQAFSFGFLDEFLSQKTLLNKWPCTLIAQ